MQEKFKTQIPQHKNAEEMELLAQKVHEYEEGRSESKIGEKKI